MIDLAAVLPPITTGFIVASGLSLLVGYAFIRRGKVRQHRWSMLTATTFAALFLVGYLARTALVGSVAFRGEGWLHTLYLGVLIPHMILATAVAPLALLTLYRALRGQFSRHRQIARITLPTWLFVAASGWVVYWMLYLL